MREDGTGLRGKEFRTQMISATDPRGAISDLAGIGFCVGDEFSDVADRNRGMNNKHVVGGCNVPYGNKVFDHVVGQIGQDRRT